MSDNSLVTFSNFVIFQTATGKVNIDVFFQNETLWLTQKKIAELFEKDRSVCIFRPNLNTDSGSI